MSGTVAAVGGHSGLSLAVRYRPTAFAHVVGQEHATTVLRAAVARRELPQQLLFSGGSGLGKTTLARIAAAALLCESPPADGDTCGTCESCRDALTPGLAHPDIIEFDAASHGGKDEIREIAARAHVAPLRSEHKIYIIDEAHGLSGPGGQAFLKTLEEPPPHVIFMLCTTDPQKMLKTNRGRCVEFELVPPSRDALIGNLRRISSGENWDIPDSVLAMVVAASDPDLGVRGTVSTLARLGALYADGGVPSDSLVASVLGIAPPSGMRRLSSAIEHCLRSEALSELTSLRTVTSDTAIRASLREWANRRVVLAIEDGGAPLTSALWALEQVVAMPPGREWLDITVARLSSPDIDGPPEATLDAARAVLQELREEVAQVASRASSVPGPGRSAAGGMTSAVAQVLAASAPAPAGLADVLSLCEVELTDSALFVSVPSDYTSRISPFSATLKTAASRLGVTLKLRRKT